MATEAQGNDYSAKARVGISGPRSYLQDAVYTL